MTDIIKNDILKVVFWNSRLTSEKRGCVLLRNIGPFNSCLLKIKLYEW